MATSTNWLNTGAVMAIRLYL